MFVKEDTAFVMLQHTTGGAVPIDVLESWHSRGIGKFLKLGHT